MSLLSFHIQVKLSVFVFIKKKRPNKNLSDFVLFFSLSFATPPLFIPTNLSHLLISFPCIPEPSWAAFQLTVYVIPVALLFIYAFFPLTLLPWQKLSAAVDMK